MALEQETLLKCREKVDYQIADISAHSTTPYGIPIFVLKDQVERKRKISASEISRVDPDSVHHQVKKKKTRGASTQLMAEKYRPKEYFELLGNDDANRQILRWLHYWRSCVFGMDPILNEYTDKLGRPLKKVLLVNGPPGTGKTSAAHVISKQAGFDILEINASDERGAAVVTDRIESAVRSHQVVSKRPVLIVADEVEGATEHGFVRALTNILKQDEKALARMQRDGSTQQHPRGKKLKPVLLLRPIIAICNDVWSPNLHSLRAQSEIVHFQKQAPMRLLKRLEDICLNEHIRVSTRQLSQIAEQCDYDLRACLNAIQFDVDKNMDTEARESAEIVDWHSLVKRQFLNSRPSTFQQLESCSDADKLISGCFTAYLESSYIDDVMKKPAALGDFLAMSDSRRATDELKAFAAHAFGQLFRSPYIAARREISSGSRTRLFGKPPSHFEEFKRTQSLVSNVHLSSSSSIKPFHNKRTLLLEILPFILHISNPYTQTILSSDDKARLKTVAQAFSDLGMTLRTEKTVNGDFVNRLDPPVELACVSGDNNQVLASSGLYVTRCHVKDALRDLKNSRQSLQRALSLKSNSGLQTHQDRNRIKEAKMPIDMPSFFGVRKTETATQLQITAGQQARRVWVQYSEGFSDAVRKSIDWEEMLYH